MTIKRDMIKLYHTIHSQGCKITRWKVTDSQAHALSPTMDFFEKMLAGRAKFFGIPITVKDK